MSHLMEEEQAPRWWQNGDEYQARRGTGRAELHAVFGDDFGMHIVSESDIGGGGEKQACRGHRKDGKRCTREQAAPYCGIHRGQVKSWGALGDFVPDLEVRTDFENGEGCGYWGPDQTLVVPKPKPAWYAGKRASGGTFQEWWGETQLFIPTKTGKAPPIDSGSKLRKIGGKGHGTNGKPNGAYVAKRPALSPAEIVPQDIAGPIVVRELALSLGRR